MGYTTDFEGWFEVDTQLDDDTFKLINGLNKTRRMARNVDAKYGVEGEFYIDGKGNMGQAEEKSIIDYNKPPKTQPSLWCCWEVDVDKKRIYWDGSEKFYSYIEWIEYLIEKILKPRGYIVNGEVKWVGEDPNDRGTIVITNNNIVVKEAYIVYVTPEEQKVLSKIVDRYFNSDLKELIDIALVD